MANTNIIKTAHIGFGPIGIRIAEMTASLNQAEIVAAIDKAGDLTGSRLGDIAKVTRYADIRIQPDAATALQAVDADVAVLATTSSLKSLIPQLEPLMAARVNVISTCEELMYPWKTNAADAQTIDRMAKDAGVSVLGLGVNPGLVMEHLPLLLSTASTDVRSINVLRRVDLRTRRQQLRDKMAVGRTADDFQAAKSRLGHVGLRESFDLLCARMGWDITTPEHTLDAIMSTSNGTVAGLSECIVGSDGHGRELTLTLQMSIEADDARDEIRIEGTPSTQMIIPGGVAGDDATAAIAINYLPAIVQASAGLMTVDCMPAPGSAS